MPRRTRKSVVRQKRGGRRTPPRRIRKSVAREERATSQIATEGEPAGCYLRPSLALRVKIFIVRSVNVYGV
jgi:hypothetical protein